MPYFFILKYNFLTEKYLYSVLYCITVEICDIALFAV